MSIKRDFKGGGTYHICNRGSKKELLFLDYHDYEYFLRTLSRFCTDTGDRILEYCLMPNHFHLILQAWNQLSIPILMRKLSTGYAMRFCKRYSEVGSIFQGRYRAKTVDSVAYLLYLSRYIHRNPIELGISEFVLSQYQWSSMGFFTMESTQKPPLRLEKQQILEYFKDVNEYKRFVLMESNQAQEWARGVGISCDPRGVTTESAQSHLESEIYWPY